MPVSASASAATIAWGPSLLPLPLHGDPTRRRFGGTAAKRSHSETLRNPALDPYEFDDEFEQQQQLQQPWKTLLETPARASWRATDPRRDPPEHVKAAMYRILDDGDRTSKQLRRAHRKVLSIQSNLADLREKERRTMVNGTRHFRQQQQREQLFHDDNDPEADEPDDGTHTNHHRRGQSSSSSINPVYYGYDETLATLKHQLTPNYAITKRVLAECQSLLGGRMDSNWKPRRVLDFGIGCGSASAAAIDLFGSNNENEGIEWVHGIDPSQPMRECSQKLIEEMTRGHHHHQQQQQQPRTASGSSPDAPSGLPSLTPRITFSTGLSPSPDESSSSSSSSSQGEGSFDLALLVYTASDLPDVSSCLAAAAMAFEKLRPNGVLVMIEPGTPDGFNSTRAVRNMLLDCCPPHDPEFEWEDRCHILAPCTHNGTCPMERHKKNFFGQDNNNNNNNNNKKPIGKLGHDAENDYDDEGDDGDYEDDDGDDGDDYDYDYDYDDEVDSYEPLKMSETEAFNSSFCSFVHSVSGDSRRKGEKFSYLVAQKQRFRRRPEGDDDHDPRTEGDPFREDHLSNLLSDAMDAASFRADDLAYRTFEAAQALGAKYTDSEHDDLGLELLQGEDKRRSMGRIVRAPIKKKGHVYIDYCAAPGRIIRSRVTKALSNSAAPGLYGAARKSRWGGLWPDTMNHRISSAEASSGDNDTKPKK
eukprot:jgi/Psemu1/187787/e_gw1.71.104.1